MPLHAHNSFTPIPAENKTTARNRSCGRRARAGKSELLLENDIVAHLFFSPVAIPRAEKKGGRSIQRRENVVVEKEKGDGEGREGTRGGAIKGPGKERELAKMLVPPSLGIFNYAKLPRDINNAG